MTQPHTVIIEPQPVFVVHDTYRRECSYLRGIQLHEHDIKAIVNQMDIKTRFYFDFHNAGRKLIAGATLNGYSGLAYAIYDYLLEAYNIDVTPLINGKDFYVQIIQ